MIFKQIILFFLVFNNICCKFFTKSSIFYQAPLLNVNFTNITLGMNIPLSTKRGSFVLQTYAGGVIAAVCQADQINQNLYSPVSFNGTINLAIQSYAVNDSIGQYATMELAKNNLFSKETEKCLSSDNIENLAGFIGIASAGINRINAEISAGFVIPFVNPNKVDQLNPDDNFAVYSSAENRTLFSIRSTIVYSNINVVIGMMKAFNWTIAANIYENSVNGQTALQAIQLYQSEYSIPIFTCTSILANDIFQDSNYYTRLCDCINGIDKLTVINLFTTAPLGYSIILELKKNCKAAKNFVFVITGEPEPLPSFISTNEVDFKSTFIIRPFGELNFTSFIDNCLTTGTLQARTTVESLLKDLLVESFNCYKYTEETKLLPPCETDIFNRPVPCICTGLELDPLENFYSSQNFFFADAVSTYANVISLLQQNCTLANMLLAGRSNTIDTQIDLCNFKNITPAVLTELMILANFTGYTGIINFVPKLLNIRASKFVAFEIFLLVISFIVKTFYLYNVHTTIRDAVNVGNFSINGFYVNYSNVVLPNGNQTISKLVPQNPNLEYAVVAVFFGILIALMILTILAFILTFALRNHIYIRRNTPIISYIILIGLFLVELSAFTICFGTYDWSCIINLFCFNIGMALILGGIIAKEYRIYKIFSNKTATAVELKITELLIIIAGLTIYFAVISVIMVSLGFGAQLIQSSSNKLYLYYRCLFDSDFKSIFFPILIEVSFFILKMFAVFLAWLTRNVTTSFSESRSVFVVVTIYLCLNIIFVPLDETLGNGTDSAIIRISIRLINVSFIAASTLIFMYYYRFWLVYLYEKKGKDREHSGIEYLIVDN